MKSILTLTLFTLLANTFWCGRNDDDVPPEQGPLRGSWDVKNIIEDKYDSVSNTRSQQSTSYTTGEKGISFEEETGIYREYENGIIVKTGAYKEDSNNSTLEIISGRDTVFFNEVFISKNHLYLKGYRRFSNWKFLKIVQATR